MTCNLVASVSTGKKFGEAAHELSPQPFSWRVSLSVQAISWVLDHSQSRLGARHVLLSIANHARSDGTGAWPGIPTIAREAKMSQRAVQYCLRRLAASGELRIQFGQGPHGCNLYSLPRMPRGAKSAPEGCKIRQKSMSKIAPEPSLQITVHKDKYGSYVITPERQRRYLAPDEPGFEA